ncbi:MAG: phytanoyl-CoA dioxygenase family protein [Xanthobacteraceae bacterium]
MRLLGYAVVDGGFDHLAVAQFAQAFDSAHAKVMAEFGAEALRSVDEHNTVRAILGYEPVFTRVANNPGILALCRCLITDYVILNQQNGVVNPPVGNAYGQAAWHRDLPYQHFVTSRPLAISALYCVDDFTIDNGTTLVLPGTHRQEVFPSDGFCQANAVPVSAPAGSYIVFDSMLYHSGGANRTSRSRRGVNNVYSIPIIRQQIELPSALGEQFTDDADLRRLLGYGVRTIRSAAEFISGRSRS